MRYDSGDSDSVFKLFNFCFPAKMYVQEYSVHIREGGQDDAPYTKYSEKYKKALKKRQRLKSVQWTCVTFAGNW